MRPRNIVITLPPVCDHDEAFMIVSAAAVTSYRPEHQCIVAGTKLTGVPFDVCVNGQWEFDYRDVTTKPGDRLRGVMFVSEEEAARRQAEWDQHDAFVSQMGHSWNGLSGETR